MRAILSGQAGLALLGNDDAVWAVSVDLPFPLDSILAAMFTVSPQISY